MSEKRKEEREQLMEDISNKLTKLKTMIEMEIVKAKKSPLTVGIITDLKQTTSEFNGYKIELERHAKEIERLIIEMLNIGTKKIE